MIIYCKIGQRPVYGPFCCEGDRMELDNDVKSTAVTARRSKKTERGRKPGSDRQEDRATTECTAGCGGMQSLKSVMAELFGKGITPYVTDYSDCRFNYPYGQGKSPPDGAVYHESSSGSAGVGMSDFTGDSYRKPNSRTKMKAVEGE